MVMGAAYSRRAHHGIRNTVRKALLSKVFSTLMPKKPTIAMILKRKRTATMYRLLLLYIGCLGLLGLFGYLPQSALADCSNESLRAELHSTGLPECRAYEMVTPAVKYGWSLFALRVSVDGSRMLAESLGSLPGSTQLSLRVFYELLREPDGWVSVPLNTPTGYTNGESGAAVAAASPNLTEGLFEYTVPGAVDQRDTDLFVRGLPDGIPIEAGPLVLREKLESTLVEIPVNSSTPSASRDLSRLLFMLTGPRYARGNLVNLIWPGDTTALRPLGGGWDSLYEYFGSGHLAPSLVGVDAGGNLIGQCGTALGYPERGHFASVQSGEVYNAISAPSGSRVYFTVAGGPCEEGGLGPPANELFASEEVSGGARRSIAISEPTTGSQGDCSTCDTSAPKGAVFQGASEDGTKAFFLSEQHLLHGAEGSCLYEYNFNAATGKRVTLIASNVSGVARVSESGERVYFVADGILTPTPNSYGDSPQLGANNLFVYNTTTGDISFVGKLATQDAEDWQTEDDRPVDASPDGRFLVFTSGADLTHVGTSIPEVFEYDAVTKKLALVSQVQGGLGGAFRAEIVFPNYTDHSDPSPQPTSVSDDGSVVVFQSEAALTAQAILGYNNVYEYHDGHVSLISDGQDRSIRSGGFPTVSLIGVDSSGKDIFFTTADPLVAQDGDTQEDVYDARIGGGFLPSLAPVCESESCQGPLAPSLTPVSAGSVSQSAGEQAIEPNVKSKSKSRVRSGRRATKERHRRRTTRTRHGARGSGRRGKR
jgi:hypothetical protein